MNAKLLADTMITSGSQLFSRKKASERLASRGIQICDVRTAMDLMACLAFLTRAASTRNVICNFSPHESKLEDIAGYSSLEDGEASYTVYVPGISTNLSKAWERIPCMDGRGKPIGTFEDWPNPTLEELLIAVAVHEVRHLLQDFISAEYGKKSRSQRLRGAIEYVGLLFEEERNGWLKEERSSEFIERRTNQREFEARVIEMLSLIDVHSGTTAQKLVRLLKIKV